jgi:hypothetical protein
MIFSPFNFIMKTESPQKEENIALRYLQELNEVEEKIQALKDRDDYKDLAEKNRAWVMPKPNEQVKGEWELLKDELAKLEKDKEFWQQTILSSNASQRKGYKKETATKSERELITTVSDYLYSLYEYPKIHTNPTFGDAVHFLSFQHAYLVCQYFLSPTTFRKKYPLLSACTPRDGVDGLMENVYSEEQWVYLVDLNHRVNGLLHNGLKKQEDGRYVVILEDAVYDKPMVQGIMIASKKIVSPDGVEIKNAESDSGRSQ